MNCKETDMKKKYTDIFGIREYSCWLQRMGARMKHKQSVETSKHTAAVISWTNSSPTPSMLSFSNFVI